MPSTSPYDLPGDRLHALDDGREDVGLVHRFLALELDRHALEARAGVDVLLRQLGARAVLVPVLRHEDEVPHFVEPSAVWLEVGFALAFRAVFAPRLRSAVEEDLAVRSTGAERVGTLRRPVVEVVVVAVDALLGNAGLDPEVVRLVVREEDRHPELVLGEAEAARLLACQQLPRPRDSFLLEVIADAEVAQHLEEGQVVVVANLVDVRRAEDLLNGDHARCGRVGEAHEVGLERHHAGAREEQRGVAVRHEGRAGDAQMPLRLHELDERAADVFGLHGRQCRRAATRNLDADGLSVGAGRLTRFSGHRYDPERHPLRPHAGNWPGLHTIDDEPPQDRPFDRNLSTRRVSRRASVRTS